MDTLFSNATVVTMDESMHQYTGGFVGVTDGKISYVGKNPPPETEKPKEIIDGTGMVLMPGLINCHTHLPMTILRGYADDYDLQTWLTDYIFPKEAHLDDRCVKAATLLGIAECLQFGVTSVTDMYDHIDAIAEAVAESGIKANLSRGTTLFDPEGFEFDKYPACQELVAARENGTTTTTAAFALRPPSTANTPPATSCGTPWPNTASTRGSGCTFTCRRPRASTTAAWKSTV